MKKIVLGIFAHPDDAEIICTGTLSLLRKAGWEIHIATMTPGDKGTTELTREEISNIRKAEAAEAVKLLGGTYHCLGFDDVYIMYDRDTINKTTALIRRIRPSIVFTASPEDYMVDHEMASKITATACFSAGIKNMDIDEPPFEPVPYLYYCDPLEGKDKLGHHITPSMYVDISTEIEMKENMLLCHLSQADWLMTHHQGNEYILAMKRFAKKRGGEIHISYAEGFRQHTGHGYPQENVLNQILPDKVLFKDMRVNTL